MKYWQVMGVMIVCGFVAVSGCAKKESNFEKAGREMDSALNEVSRDLDRNLNQR